MGPLEEAIQWLDGIPGMGRRSAQDLLAEIGSDMSRFPTEAHLNSWAKVCPGNNESAGKRKNGGHRERSSYGNQGMEKVDGFLKTAFTADGVTIYEMADGIDQSRREHDGGAN